MFTFQNNHSGHGVRDVQCPTGGPVTTNSIILASATEVFWDGQNWIPFQGSASIQVLNCVPRPEEFRRTLCSGEYLVGQRYCNPRQWRGLLKKGDGSHWRRAAGGDDCQAVATPRANRS